MKVFEEEEEAKATISSSSVREEVKDQDIKDYRSEKDSEKKVQLPAEHEGDRSSAAAEKEAVGAAGAGS